MKRTIHYIFPFLLKINLLVIFLYFPCFSSIAQKKANKLGQYETWVIKMDGTKLNGILHEVDDSKLMIHGMQSKYIKFSALEINKIQFRRMNQKGTATAIGALAGMAVGIAIGVSQTSGSDCNQGFSCVGSGIADAEEDMTNALLYGLGLGVVGAVVGNAIGSTKIIIPINGKMDLFRANLAQMKKYVIPRKYYE